VTRSSQVPEFAEKLHQSFGESALVAIGMILEEMLTASLLPLAGLHVQRCRELEKVHSEEETESLLLNPINGQSIPSHQTNINETETPFQEWTLPPEEAMFKLLEQGMVPREGVPLVREPTRATAAAAGAEESVEDRRKESIRNWLESQMVPRVGREGPAAGARETVEDSRKESLRNWLKSQELDPDLVAKNREVFRLFLSAPARRKRRKAS
jgi:hypothetical protein